MRKWMCLLIMGISLFTLAGCQKTMSGTDELIDKARKEIPIAEADTAELNYAGQYDMEDSTLMWFISGDEYQVHYYLPMECKVEGEYEYSFVRTYEAMEGATDIAVLNWNRGYCFLINNANCKSIKITDGSGTREISIEEDGYPYIFYNEEIPIEYLFLDEDGESIW